MKGLTIAVGGGLLLGAAFLIFVPTWTGAPRAATETGVSGNAQFEPLATFDAINKAPPALPPAATGGLMATAVYKNVQVLTDVTAAEFMRTQQALTDWVSPKQGCDFCHAGNDYVSDAKPTKAAARVMLQMTRHMNADWSTHVAPSGVTCYSCHRGQPVPSESWFPQTPPPKHALIEAQDNWQESGDTVRKFFPDAGWAEYYLQDEPIAVLSATALAGSHTIGSFDETKRIYEMMMQQSDGIGVNCGYCHQSRNFADWNESTPMRWNGFTGIRMVRDLNKNFLLTIGQLVPQTRELTKQNSLPVIPARQSGLQNGNGLTVCKTCHYGVPKPLNGVNMVHDYPALTPVANRQP